LILGGGKEWMPNTSAWDNSNWLHAAIALDAAEPATRKVAYKDDKTRFILETGVEVVWFPPEEGQGQGNNEVAELALVITIQVYVDLEALATPLPDVGTELVGLILHSLIPTSTPSTAKSESEARAAALRYFFECMRPAPYLPRDFPVHSLQPQGLVSTLHPFQMRTVAFLLQREQAASFPGALQIPVPGRNRPRDRDPDGWWADISFGDDDRRAFRRATGSLVTLNDTSQSNDKGKGKEKEKAADAWEGLSEADLDLLPTLVDLSAVRGSMLCEEMGESTHRM
jgi:E3 ubiquitin-protein ligase SHPRH